MSALNSGVNQRAKKTVLRKSHNVPTDRLQPADGTVVGRFFVSWHHVRLLPWSEERPCRCRHRRRRNWRNMSVWQIFQQSVAPKPVWLSHSHQLGSKRWLALRPPLQDTAAHSEMLQAVSHLPLLVRPRPLLIPGPWLWFIPAGVNTESKNNEGGGLDACPNRF